MTTRSTVGVTIGDIIGALGPAFGGESAARAAPAIIGLHHRKSRLRFNAQDDLRKLGVCTTWLWSGIGSAILYQVVEVIVGTAAIARPNAKGLDITEHTDTRNLNM